MSHDVVVVSFVMLSLLIALCLLCLFFFFKQKTAYEMRISDWSSDVCSSDLPAEPQVEGVAEDARVREDARDERGEQSDADQPDEEDAPGDGEVEVDVEARDEFGPREIRARRDLAAGVGEELGVGVGVDVEEQAREIGRGKRDSDMLDPRAAQIGRA